MQEPNTEECKDRIRVYLSIMLRFTSINVKVTQRNTCIVQCCIVNWPLGCYRLADDLYCTCAWFLCLLRNNNMKMLRINMNNLLFQGWWWILWDGAVYYEWLWACLSLWEHIYIQYGRTSQRWVCWSGKLIDMRICFRRYIQIKGGNCVDVYELTFDSLLDFRGAFLPCPTSSCYS